MMSDFLFGKLVSLREEDFLTVSFGYLLQKDTTLKSDYLRLLGIRNTKKCKITLQPRYGARLEDRPDMEIRGPDIIVFQENKVQSTESRRQLKRYAKRLNSYAEKRRLLVYMTKDYAESRLWQDKEKYPVDSIFLRWEQIAPLLKRGKHFPGNYAWLRQEVYNFLEERNMIPSKPLNVNTINRYWHVFEPERRNVSMSLGHLPLAFSVAPRLSES